MTIRCGSGGRASPWPIRSVTSSAGGGCCSIQATMFPNPTLQQLDREPQARQFEILDAFAAFTVRLHEKGVLDYDYNPGNIFYYREDGAWNFALIDVNRMAFRRNLSRRDCVEMLHHLDWETPYLDYVLIRYAELRRWDWKLLSGAVLLKQGINLPVRIRRFFKRLIGRK